MPAMTTTTITWLPSSKTLIILKLAAATTSPTTVRWARWARSTRSTVRAEQNSTWLSSDDKVTSHGSSIDRCSTRDGG
ncbi:hypothetical protein CPB83DRAFT_855773 [Crepidotus variabilis]|uniref:Uncharacterized protein n=1 Tax=Crepidotus variabilis TaxID=179855 RepID=A0A9P6JNQ6_9AGAR|nr:hypothetical protein CPB83DRAFT_855773 [Crepidotus variabilis]